MLSHLILNKIKSFGFSRNFSRPDIVIYRAILTETCFLYQQFYTRNCVQMSINISLKAYSIFQCINLMVFVRSTLEIVSNHETKIHIVNENPF